jgi:hypothetical protein
MSMNTENVDTVRTVMISDQYVTIEETAYETGISYGSVHSITKEDLSVWYACKIYATYFDKGLGR